MPRQLCPKMCKECPFKRSSTPGWLGSSSGDPWEFLRGHYIEGDTPLPCHMTVNWEAENAQELAMQAPVCRGYMTFLRNTMKMPHDPEMAELYRNTVANRDDVFANINEFIQHHYNDRLAAAMRG